MTLNPPGIIMYTTQWCGDCRRAKRILAELGCDYTEVDIERTPGAAELVMGWANGKRVVPTITIGERVLVNPRGMELELAVRENWVGVCGVGAPL